MLNDNYIMFLEQTPPSNGHCYYNCDNGGSNPFAYYDLERGYLSNFREEEECYRQYAEALQRRAYLEAVERERQERQMEERRRHLLEVARRRQEQEEEQRLRRQYMAHVQRKRQERLNEERMRREKLAAHEAYKRREAMRRAAHTDQGEDRSSQMHPLQQRIFQGPDGNIYRVLLQPDEANTARLAADERSTHPTVHQEELESALFGNRRPRAKYATTAAPSSSAPSSSIGHIGTPYPSVNNVTFKGCFNVNKSDDDTCSKQIAKAKDIKMKLKRKPLKSSVLVGDVEDASDSECEDEFKDTWHNRRPQPGKWIEPVESMAFTRRF